MRRLVLIIALLVIGPIIEIAVLVAVGQQIGVGPTLLLMLATSALGGVLLRHQGGRAWRAFRADLDNGVPPGVSATDGLLVLIGGLFMLVPGFVSDVIGLLLIAPPTRRVARSYLMHLVTRRLTPAASTTLFGPRRVRATFGRPRSTGADRPASARTDPAGGPATTAVAIEGEIIDP
jgi:UPF0716 protein FxsA